MRIAKGRLGWVLWGLILLTLLALLIQLNSGCCWVSKRDCFPPCPPPPPPTVVTVEKDCTLPPSIKLPGVKRTEDGCPEGRICYAVEEAAKIALREAKLKAWIKEVRARCGPAASSQPASRPANP